VKIVQLNLNRDLNWYVAVWLVVLVSFPYKLVSPSVSVLAFFFLSAPGLILRPYAGLPKVYVVCFAWFLSYLLLALNLERPFQDVVSQSNHFLQFFIFYYCIFSVISRCDIAKVLLDSKRLVFTPIFTIFISSVVGFENSFSGYGLYPHVDISVIYVLSVIFVAGMYERGARKASWILLGIAYLSLLGSRSVFAFLIICLVFFSYCRVSRSLLLAVSLLGAIVPILFSILSSEELLGQLYFADGNTAIRVEFLKSAFGLLEESPIFGVGFGTPYRDYMYSEYMVHSILSGEYEMSLISNHNSFFDTTLRMGIIFSLLFFLGMFYRVSKNPTPLESFLVVISVFGFSFDAWFESQQQITLVSLVAAILTSIRSYNCESSARSRDVKRLFQ